MVRIFLSLFVVGFWQIKHIQAWALSSWRSLFMEKKKKTQTRKTRHTVHAVACPKQFFIISPAEYGQRLILLFSYSWKTSEILKICCCHKLYEHNSKTCIFEYQKCKVHMGLVVVVRLCPYTPLTIELLAKGPPATLWNFSLCSVEILLSTWGLNVAGLLKQAHSWRTQESYDDWMWPWTPQWSC